MARIVKPGYNVRVKDANGRVRFARVVTVVDQDNITYRIGHQTTNTFAATRAAYSHGGLLFEQDSVPDKPYNVAVTVGNSEATFTGDILNNGGSAVTDIEYKVDAGSWTSSGETAFPITITSLQNGETYSVLFRAVNATGNGFASTAVSAVLPDAVASAPTALVATPADVTCSIAFTVPADDGGSAITDYEFKVGAGAWTTGATDESPVVVTGLTAETEYSVLLRAVTAVGNGAASAACVFTTTA